MWLEVAFEARTAEQEEWLPDSMRTQDAHGIGFTVAQMFERNEHISRKGIQQRLRGFTRDRIRDDFAVNGDLAAQVAQNGRPSRDVQRSPRSLCCARSGKNLERGSVSHTR